MSVQARFYLGHALFNTQSLQLAQIAEKRSRSDNDMTPLEMVINRDLLVTMKSGKYGQALPMIG